jgi:glutamate-5-semialdehyde dehydrogenase
VDAQALVNELADKARLAARTLSVATGTERASALLAIADEIEG